ncbi:hypothetical protein CEXT_137941 [Caerostris extrusa]|uniref:Uncharacterized protein n=1 Tax=Caerostris extrusa TaxID=172846 RepID=A0AAV4QBU2_CAEEX|nr:hypothetical protein CEXT_137941 [Caerostris extrusa]
MQNLGIDTQKSNDSFKDNFCLHIWPECRSNATRPFHDPKYPDSPLTSHSIGASSHVNSSTSFHGLSLLNSSNISAKATATDGHHKHFPSHTVEDLCATNAFNDDASYASFHDSRRLNPGNSSAKATVADGHHKHLSSHTIEDSRATNLSMMLHRSEASNRPYNKVTEVSGEYTGANNINTKSDKSAQIENKEDNGTREEFVPSCERLCNKIHEIHQTESERYISIYQVPSKPETQRKLLMPASDAKEVLSAERQQTCSTELTSHSKGEQKTATECPIKVTKARVQDAKSSTKFIDADISSTNDGQQINDEHQKETTIDAGRSSPNDGGQMRANCPMYERISSPDDVGQIRINSPVYERISSPDDGRQMSAKCFMNEEVSSPKDGRQMSANSPMYERISSPVYERISSPVYERISSPDDRRQMSANSFMDERISSQRMDFK